MSFGKDIEGAANEAVAVAAPLWRMRHRDARPLPFDSRDSLARPRGQSVGGSPSVGAFRASTLKLGKWVTSNDGRASMNQGLIGASAPPVRSVGLQLNPVEADADAGGWGYRRWSANMGRWAVHCSRIAAECPAFDVSPYH